MRIFGRGASNLAVVIKAFAWTAKPKGPRSWLVPTLRIVNAKQFAVGTHSNDEDLRRINRCSRRRRVQRQVLGADESFGFLENRLYLSDA